LGKTGTSLKKIAGGQSGFENAEAAMAAEGEEARSAKTKQSFPRKTLRKEIK